MHVIATAGHVDHGKSTLVTALTGIDPDRLDEEKRRGMTIDLGFAWLRLPSGREVGLVDVPGHERFISNMLAGVGAINVTLFVVAANEGWKPQSQEHLDILDLLGVEAAVVAITKSDLVDDGGVREVLADVQTRLARTSLNEAPSIPVSASTGEGLPALLAELERVIDAAPPAQDLGRPRLWVDRVFTMKGAGTVVTGTLVGGTLEVGDDAEISPSGARARIRSIQSHRRIVSSIGPGQRTALNLAGVEPAQVQRGDVIGRPGSWSPTSRLLTEVRFLAHSGFEAGDRGAFKFHTGSAERDCSVMLLGEGTPRFAAISLSEPVVADFKDRFVLREAGRRATIGGGVVLEPHPRAFARRDSSLLRSAEMRAEARDRDDYFRAVLLDEGRLAIDEISKRIGVAPNSRMAETGIWLGAVVFSDEEFARLSKDLLGTVQGHQDLHPLDPGLPREAARAGAGLDAKIFEDVLVELAKRQLLVADEAFVRTPSHVPSVSGPEHDALLEEILMGGASPPTVGELEVKHARALIAAMVRGGELVQISGDIVYPVDWVEGLKSRLTEEIERSGPMTVAAFRDLAGTTRRYAVPLLEYLDRIRFTRRQGDVRVLAGPAR